MSPSRLIKHIISIWLGVAIILFIALSFSACGHDSDSSPTDVPLPSPIVQVPTLPPLPSIPSIQIPAVLRKVLLVCDGNSLVAGAESTDPMTDSIPAVLQRMLPYAWDIRNKGVSGRSTETQLSDAPTLIDPLFDTSAALNLLLAWEGINSYRGPHDTPDQALDAMKEYVQGRQAAGFKVAVLTIVTMYASDPPGFSDWRAEYNRRLQAGETGADLVLDMNGAYPAFVPRNRTPDYHFTTEGYLDLALFLEPRLITWANGL